MTPPGDHAADEVPQLEAPARIQPRGRLVQVEHPRPPDQARREIQSPPHATGVGLRRPVRRVAQVEVGQQLPGPQLCLTAGDAQQPADEHQVFGAGEVFVDRGILPGQPDELAHLVRVETTSWPRTQARALIRLQQRGEDPDRGGLAGAVGPSRPSTVPVRTERFTPASAVVSPNRLTSPSAKIA